MARRSAKCDRADVHRHAVRQSLSVGEGDRVHKVLIGSIVLVGVPLALALTFWGIWGLVLLSMLVQTL